MESSMFTLSMPSPFTAFTTPLLQVELPLMGCHFLKWGKFLCWSSKFLLTSSIELPTLHWKHSVIIDRQWHRHSAVDWLRSRCLVDFILFFLYKVLYFMGWDRFPLGAVNVTPVLNEGPLYISAGTLSDLQLLCLTLSFRFDQVARMASSTSGTRSTRNACASSTDTPPASPRWPSTTMEPCSPSPPHTCRRRATSVTRRTPYSSARSQTPRPNPSESLDQPPLVVKV